MDDFNVSALHDSKNEWTARLVQTLTPHIVDGFKSILAEAVKTCRDSHEYEKYLMTFQNFLSRVPKWNPSIIETERKRIVEKSGCHYLEDLVTCVHIIQLKILTMMRVGKKQKKVNINIPKLDDFIHECYSACARKLYTAVYLFQIDVAPLTKQKNMREVEIIVQECIMKTLRDKIPVAPILRAYLDESVEEDVVEEVKEQIVEKPMPVEMLPAPTQPASVISTSSAATATPAAAAAGPTISFNDLDYVMPANGSEATSVPASKDLDRLEQISQERNQMRKMMEMEEMSDEDEPPLVFLDSTPSAGGNGGGSSGAFLSADDFPELTLDDIESL